MGAREEHGFLARSLSLVLPERLRFNLTNVTVTVAGLGGK